MFRAIHQFKIDHPYIAGTAEFVIDLIAAGVTLGVIGVLFLFFACAHTYCGGAVF